MGFLILSIVSVILVFITLLEPHNTIIINGYESKVINIPKNGDSLDGKVLISISSDSKSGEVKLINGGDWYDSENDLHFNIKKSQVEKWKFNSSGELIKKVVNDGRGIQVDNQGIIIKSPFSKIFTDVAMEDMVLEVKNISKQRVTIKVEWIYK